MFGCKDVDKSKNRNYFYYNEDQNITTLDPAFVKSQSENWVVAQLFEGLVEFDDSLHLQPCLAKDWELDSTNLVYTFHLRGDAYFHDNAVSGLKNTKITAKDFVYSFRRIADPATASPGSWIFNDKMDLSCFSNKGKNTPFPVIALNDSTLRIILSKPFAPFLGILAMPYCYVIPEKAVNHYGSAFRSNPVGSGPFMLKIWEEEVEMLLVKNENYYGTQNGKSLPYLDGIVISQIRNKQTAFMNFAQGRYDFFNGIDASIKDELLTKSGSLKQKYQERFTLNVAPFLNTEFLGINIDPAFKSHPLNNKKIRQAINYAIDRKKLVIYLRNNTGFEGVHGFVPPGIPDYQYPKGYDYNPEKAKTLIKESGIDLSKAPKILLTTTQDYLDIVVFVQKELKAVGIEMAIDVRPGSFIRQARKDQKINFFRASWIADYPDPENYLACFFSPNFSPAGPNYSHYYNPVFDSLYNRQDTSISERNNNLSKMDSLIVDDAPVIFLYYDKSVRLVQPYVKGLGSNPQNSLKLKTVRKEF
ncbi:MAG: ABC transporter substrate-binding protein [Bacteroidia bacterium]|nr:ABC transporter substrate-binding protein [Bacteroidia bacterium]